ncbi:MAG: tRNA pseudouridine(38-40) synthase TruA [Chloroflexota bacterium]
MNPTRFALIIEYNGTKYYGFQWQPKVPTIQAELEKALQRLCGEQRRVMCASRTDAGVHAEGQVVSFWAERVNGARMLVEGMNYYLPRDIAVREAYQMTHEFNVRRDAVSREYQYTIVNRPTRSPLRNMFSLLVRQPLDLEAMGRACDLLRGRQDFISCATALNESEPTLRDVSRATVEREGEYVVFRITGNSFLRHQVRNTVGALIRIGLGKMSVAQLQEAMAARQPGVVGPTAPAKGLILTKVNYESGCFPPGNQQMPMAA